MMLILILYNCSGNTRIYVGVFSETQRNIMVLTQKAPTRKEAMIYVVVIIGFVCEVK